MSWSEVPFELLDVESPKVETRLVLAAKGETLAGNSNGGTVLSSLASHTAAAQTSFSESQEAAKSKLCSRSVNLMECGKKPDVSFESL